MKKTLNSWETPAAPLSVTELIQEAQQEAEEKDSGPESSKSEDGGGEKEEKKLQSLKDDDDDVQAIVGEEEVYLVKDVAEFAGEKIESVPVFFFHFVASSWESVDAGEDDEGIHLGFLLLLLWMPLL